MENPRKRNPWLAALMSSLTPGLGQIYNGQRMKSLVHFLLIPLISLVPLLLDLRRAGAGLMTFLVMVLAVCMIVIMSALDAFIQARKIGDLHLTAFNSWYAYLGMLLAFNLVLFPLAQSMMMRGVMFSEVTSRVMEPYLLAGDRILAETGYYPGRSPLTGDVVILPCPEDSARDCIRRVIAVQGQTVRIQSGKVFITGEPGSVQTSTAADSGNAHGPLSSDFGPLSIPPGRLFLMGDSRDAGSDRSFWVLVDGRDIRGRPLIIFWSRNPDRIGLPVQ